jgi:hypothetical protein
MRSPRAALLAALLAAPTLLDCSLMSLDDFGSHGCQTDADCSPAEKALADAKRCERYFCEQGSCVPRHSRETCNGQDDDCDDLIDEGLVVKPHERTGNTVPDAFMDYARPTSTNGDGFVVSGDGSGNAHGFVVRGADADEPTALSFASAAVDPQQDSWHCPSRTVSAGVAASDCTMKAVAVGADDENLVYAAVNTLGCARGQLRVGLATANDPFRIWLGSSEVGEDDPRSNIEVGVDVGSSNGRCSGDSVPDEEQQAVGARSPAVAVLEAYPGGAGALVSWLAASFDLPVASCSSTVDVPVQALGVMVPEDARNEDERWLVGSDKGLPASIGRSSSLQPPAVVGLAAEGDTGRYLVAFPSNNKDDENGVALVFVTVKGAQLSFTEAPFIVAAHADFVGLGQGENGGELALAWRSGCDAKSQLMLALLTVEGSSLKVWKTFLLATGNIVSAPRLLHASDGFRTRGNRGGWYVAWSEQLRPGVGRSRLARVADAPSPTPAEVFTVTSGALGFPLLFPGEHNTVNHGLIIVTDTETPSRPFFEPWCQ